MKRKEILNKVLNPTSKAKEEMKRLGILNTSTSGYTKYVCTSGTTMYPSYSSATWTLDDFKYPTIVDPYNEGEQEVAIRKDNDTFTLKRKELYRLIFLLEDNGYTIETCPLEEFITILTSVRL